MSAAAVEGYRWRPGKHPPHDAEGNVIPASAVKAALDELPEPSPERLLDASKRKRHVLHDELWGEGDQVWAQRGRLERCRHIISSVGEVIIIGGKTIEVRAVEFVRTSGADGRWADIHAIMSDDALRAAHLASIIALQEQALAKLSRFEEWDRNRTK